LKDLFTATGGAGVILQQRNSEFLKRRIMRPVRGDVYGGEGALQSLDGCFSLFRPAKWLGQVLTLEERPDIKQKLEGQIAAATGYAELYGLKQRFGEEGYNCTVDHGNALRFEGQFTRFLPHQEPPERQDELEML
jgi:hypothetical protein